MLTFFQGGQETREAVAQQTGVRAMAADSMRPVRIRPRSSENVVARPVPEPFPNLVALSPQERRIVALFALDYTIKETARELRIHPETVKTYTRRIYAKLGVHTKAGCVAVAYARLME